MKRIFAIILVTLVMISAAGCGKYTGAADPDIGRRQINRLFRRLHEHGNRLCENDHDKAENGTDHGKQSDRQRIQFAVYMV